MSRPLPFDVAPWSIGISGLDESQLAHRESVFALSNGHIGWRGNLDEGEPNNIAGSYLNGVFEQHPMPYAEEGYGYPEDGQSVVNVPDGQIIRLFVGDEPLDLRHGRVTKHEQRLDFQAGTLRRELDWTSPSGFSVRVTSTRLISFAQRSIAAVRYRVEAIDRPVTITVQSEVVANEEQPDVHPDPRVTETMTRPLESIDQFLAGSAATIAHKTRNSRLGIAVTMNHVVTTSAKTDPSVLTEVAPDLARATITVPLQPGEHVDVVKFVGYEWSATLTAAALRDRSENAVHQAVRVGWDGLVEGQRERLDDFWSSADVQVDGEPRLQQAIRFALFHVFQASARLERRSVPGKGLTGAGYQGHTFWDFEGFVLPVLTYTAPEAAEQALRWRHNTLDYARDRAAVLRLKGASFAWRTIDGRESSGYWPASTAAMHVNADIAGAVIHYVRTTGDDTFEREAGLEILVETARLWASFGRWDSEEKFHIDGVTGPDEYSALINDNVYTNLAAQLNLRGAVDAAQRHPELAHGFGVTDDEIDGWAHAADAMYIPFDERRGVHPQSEGFTEQAVWAFDSMENDDYPLQSNFPYFDIYRKQVIKQADVVLALYFAHQAFTPEQKARAFDYYEKLTVRDSSLSAAVQSVIAAEVGHLDLAADYLAEAATLDLDDLRENTAEGLHLASLAGLWTAFTAGLGGMRDTEAGLRFAPRLPEQITSLRFGLRISGRILRVAVSPDATEYLLEEGEAMTLFHFGEQFTVSAGTPETKPTPPLADPGPRPTQPRTRSPRDFAAALAAE
jgi:alpha,alpha-trehalose phosphorylase